jgi:acetyltransferase-like isoleucine patch superfamily enzyme
MHNLSIDKANSKNISIYQRFKSYLYLKYHNVKFGSNTFVKKNFEIKKSKNSFIEIGDNCIIQENAFFLLTMPNPKLTIGDNVSIGRSSIIAIKDHLKIGSNTEISANVFICDQSHNILKGELITNQSSIIEKVIIGSDVWIGTGVTVLKGVTIGNGSVVGANSVVNKNIPDYQIWAGNPAKFIRER